MLEFGVPFQPPRQEESNNANVTGHGTRIGENLLYGFFKGARSAPRGLASAHAEAPREVGTWPSVAHRLSVTG